MARTITDEQIRLSVIVNGDPAQKELLDLEKATRKVTEENKALIAQKKIMERQGKKGTAEYKALTAAIRQNSDTVKLNKDRMKELQGQIGITSLTLGQLRQRATVLRATLSNMMPGSADFKRVQAELTQVNQRIAELTGRAQAAQWSLRGMADSFNRYAAMVTAGIAALAGVVLSIQKVIDINGKLSDAQSDVMKTTGMTKKEVDELTKSFGAFKTRTARMELLELATEAGRLGITGVENVRAFTEQANKMKVALGDDLSTEQIREVGKMVNVYKVGEATGRDFAGAMDALGSSINEVAASGANQAGFLVDYLKRQAGISAQTKLSAADNVGYAATFDEIGQSVEVSATAMNKVWMDMFKQPEQYAKIAKMGVGEFKKLMEEDANEAMIRFLEGLNGNQEGLEIMLEKLKDLEVGGARGVQSISALANNTKLLRERQAISNQAMQEATSLTDEYNLKNNNLAGTIDKIKKTMMGWFSSETIIGGLTGFFEWFGKLIGATDDLDGSVTRFRDRLIVFLKILTIVIMSYLSYNAALKLTVLWTNTVATATKIYTAIQNRALIVTGLLRSAKLLLIAAYSMLTGNVARASAAMRIFNATVATNPLGLLLVALVSVGTALFLFKKRTDEASFAQKKFSDIQKQVASDVKLEKDNLETLLAIARDETASKEARLKAIKEINKISPEYLGNIDLENINTQKTTASINKYLQALSRKIELEAIDSELKASKQRALQAETQDLEEYGKWYDGLWGMITGDVSSAAQDKVVAAAQRQTEDLSKETELQEKLFERRKSLMQSMFEEPVVEPDPTKKGGSGLTDDQKKKLEDERKKRIDDLRKAAEERIKMEREAEDAILANMEDGYKKQWQLEQTNHTRRIQELQNRLVSISDIEQAMLKSKNMKLSKEEREYWRQQTDNWQANNKHVYSLLESEEQAHQFRLGKIQEQAAKNEIDVTRKNFDDKITLIRTEMERELAMFAGNEAERERIRREYQQKELDEEEKFLQELIKKFNLIVGREGFNNFDLSLLTPEQVAEFEAQAAQVGLSLQELINKRNELTGGISNAEALGISDNRDILGFSRENWQVFYDNLHQGKLGIDEMIFAASALTNLWGQYSQFVSANENAQLRNFEKNNEARKRSLKKQLDNGYINQVQYKREIEKMEVDTEKKRAELAYRQAKREKAIAMASTITGTAQAVVGALGNKPWTPFNFVLASMVGAMGALNLATIAKTPLPAKGFESGLYPDYVTREQDGKRFRTTGSPKSMNKSGLYSKPTILVGEGPGDMPEMIIDKRSFARMNPALKDALIREIRTIKGFEGGYYDNMGTMQIPSGGQDDGKYEALLTMMMSVVSENTAAIRELRDKGVIGKFMRDDYPSMKNLEEAMKNYRELKQKARK